MQVIFAVKEEALFDDQMKNPNQHILEGIFYLYMQTLAIQSRKSRNCSSTEIISDLLEETIKVCS